MLPIRERTHHRLFETDKASIREALAKCNTPDIMLVKPEQLEGHMQKAEEGGTLKQGTVSMRFH